MKGMNYNMSFASILLLLFMGMFWLFRVVVAFTTSIGMDIGFTPINMTTEIILLFAVFICALFIAKNKIIGAIAYLGLHGYYFGTNLYNALMPMINGQTMALTDYTNVMVSFIAIVIPICILFNMLFEKNRKAHPVDKKTDWFYKNEEFDRKLDERADQNEYRNY